MCRTLIEIGILAESVKFDHTISISVATALLKWKIGENAYCALGNLVL